jgi:hypothetical protein
MKAACPFCGSWTELSHNGGEHPHTGQKISPTAHFRVCTDFGCRARGPVRGTPGDANLAFLLRLPKLREAGASRPAPVLFPCAE